MLIPGSGKKVAVLASTAFSESGAPGTSNGSLPRRFSERLYVSAVQAFYSVARRELGSLATDAKQASRQRGLFELSSALLIPHPHNRQIAIISFSACTEILNGELRI